MNNYGFKEFLIDLFGIGVMLLVSTPVLMLAAGAMGLQ